MRDFMDMAVTEFSEEAHERLAAGIRIAVLSGKGGTGKTFVSVNMAAAAAQSGMPVTYVDCDVEEPNGHLFFKPEIQLSETAAVLVPETNVARCDGCRVCVDFCRFHALAWVGGRVRLFPEVCHACGGCVLMCPRGAMTEKERNIGEWTTGRSENVEVLSGMLRVGEESGVPLIRGLLRKIHEKARGTGPVLIDCPPGSSCAVMESIRTADLCLLVAEPTIFGAHNLAMVHELAMTFGLRYGVVLNKCQSGRNPSEDYCREHGIPVLGRIPADAKLAAVSTNGRIVARESDEWSREFRRMLDLAVCGGSI